MSYIYRDYAGLRQLMLDRLAVTMPDWTEQHEPDIWITLIELLAYIGDDLSYYEDAVATEAYLQTARNRVSVRRHARLVGYRLHEGCNARAWVCVDVTSPVTLPLGRRPLRGGGLAGSARDRRCSTRARSRPTRWSPSSSTPRCRSGPARDGLQPVNLLPAHNEIGLWSWGESDSHLATGATSAVLIDGAPPDGAGKAPQRTLELRVGDVLILGRPKTRRRRSGTGRPVAAPGRAPDRRAPADRRRFTEQPLLEVQWAPRTRSASTWP